MRGDDRRAAESEAELRDVNESLAYVAKLATDDSNSMRMVCECGDPGCAEFLEISAAEYQEVRQAATHFVVLPGHELPDIERVVRRTPGFSVVEKRAGVPAEVAREENPRS